MATIKLYINTDRGDISRAFVKSTSEPTTDSNVPALVAGNKRNIEVYLIDSAGNYDARSGASNYALSIGAGPLAGTPSSGTFTLTDGTSTTTALAFNAGAQAVENALNALNSNAGPHSQLVDVTSTYDGNYRVKFRTTGAVANLSGDASELSPASAVVIDEAVAGDGSTKEQQYIRLLRQPAIFQDTFTQIANGWSGELSANNARVLELMAGRDTIAIPLDVELTETGNEPETIARGNMLLSNEVINPASIDPANLAQLLTEALGDARYLRTTNNLSDVTNAATARSNIGAAAAADVSNVDNTSDASKPVSTAQQTALDLKADDADLTSHTGNTSNPHSVTAAQLGLGNVDNTSDADKPVSTAQQTALDLKADATALTTETNARIDADNRREFAGGVALDGGYITENISEINLQTNGSRVIKFSTPLAFSGSTEYILGYRIGTTNTRIYLTISASGVLSYTIGSGEHGSEQLATNTTYFVQIQWSGTNSELFVNGVSKQTATYSASGTGTPSSKIGSTPTGLSTFIGAIYETAIFNTALTATQAAELYQQGLQTWLAANPEYRRGGDFLQTEINTSDLSDSTWTELGSGTATFSANAVSGGSGPRQVLSNKVFPQGTKVRFQINLTANVSNNTQLGVHFYNVNNGSLTAITPNSTASRNIDSEFTLTADSKIRIRSEGGTVADWSFSNFEITQLGALATLPLDDDCRQLKDISGNRNDATASESGVTHLNQKDLHSFRDDNADGTGGSYLIANADILAENEVITGVTVDGRFYAASGAQDLTKRRIKLVTNGSNLEVKRSNGTADDSAIAVTNPSDGTDFAITVLTQRI